MPIIMQLDKFRKALRDESIYPTTKRIVDYIVSTGQRVDLKKYECLIEYNEINDNIYFIIDGIIRRSVINEQGTERTDGFGLCGTMVYSTQCYVLGKQSICRISACCDTVLLKIPKAELNRHIDEDHEFCRWICGMFGLTVCYKEMRSDGFNGDAAFRYKWLKEDRPEILENVSDKIIASYLNITEVHLSRIKNKLLKGKI